jgi:hypothetical protein
MLVVSGDMFGNFEEEFLNWIRKCYKDLAGILATVKRGKRFTLLGTSGIGKFFLIIFWICYRATLKEKVVWKFSNITCYLLDVSDEASSVPKAYSLFRLDDPCLEEVLENPDAWLVIDGEQSCSLHHECHILLACLSRYDNHKELSKNLMVRTLYIPVWAEEEITEFLGGFKVPKAKYRHMNVLVKWSIFGS